MDNRKKILQVNISNQGGAFSLIYQAQTELQDKFVFDYFSSNEFLHNEVYQDLLAMGSKCIGGVKCRSRFFKQYKIYKTLNTYLKNESYDFVHIHADTSWKLAVFFLAARNAGIDNIIVHSHSSGVAGHFRVINYLLHVLMRPVIKKAKYKCACSKVAARWMYSTEKDVLYIQNGVDIQKYKYNTYRRKEIRQ